MNASCGNTPHISKQTSLDASQCQKLEPVPKTWESASAFCITTNDISKVVSDEGIESVTEDSGLGLHIASVFHVETGAVDASGSSHETCNGNTELGGRTDKTETVSVRQNFQDRELSSQTLRDFPDAAMIDIDSKFSTKNSLFKPASDDGLCIVQTILEDLLDDAFPPGDGFHKLSECMQRNQTKQAALITGKDSAETSSSSACSSISASIDDHGIIDVDVDCDDSVASDEMAANACHAMANIPHADNDDDTQCKVDLPKEAGDPNKKASLGALAWKSEPCTCKELPVERHRRSVSLEGHFHCSQCEMVLFHWYNLIRHEATVHRIEHPGLVDHKCPLCAYSAMNIAQYGQHISNHYFRQQDKLDDKSRQLLQQELEKCEAIGVNLLSWDVNGNFGDRGKQPVAKSRGKHHKVASKTAQRSKSVTRKPEGKIQRAKAVQKKASVTGKRLPERAGSTLLPAERAASCKPCPGKVYLYEVTKEGKVQEAVCDRRRMHPPVLPGRKKLFYCQCCFYRTPKKVNLVNHYVSLHNKRAAVTYRCCLCAYSTIKKGNFMKHVAAFTHVEAVKKARAKYERENGGKGSALSPASGIMCRSRTLKEKKGLGVAQGEKCESKVTLRKILHKWQKSEKQLKLKAVVQLVRDPRVERYLLQILSHETSAVPSGVERLGKARTARQQVMAEPRSVQQLKAKNKQLRSKAVVRLEKNLKLEHICLQTGSKLGYIYTVPSAQGYDFIYLWKKLDSAQDSSVLEKNSHSLTPEMTTRPPASKESSRLDSDSKSLHEDFRCLSKLPANDVPDLSSTSLCSTASMREGKTYCRKIQKSAAPADGRTDNGTPCSDSALTVADTTSKRKKTVLAMKKLVPATESMPKVSGLTFEENVAASVKTNISSVQTLVQGSLQPSDRHSQAESKDSWMLACDKIGSPEKPQRLSELQGTDRTTGHLLGPLAPCYTMDNPLVIQPVIDLVNNPIVIEPDLEPDPEPDHQSSSGWHSPGLAANASVTRMSQQGRPSDSLLLGTVDLDPSVNQSQGAEPIDLDPSVNQSQGVKPVVVKDSDSEIQITDLQLHPVTGASGRGNSWPGSGSITAPVSPDEKVASSAGSSMPAVRPSQGSKRSARDEEADLEIVSVTLPKKRKVVQNSVPLAGDPLWISAPTPTGPVVLPVAQQGLSKGRQSTVVVRVVKKSGVKQVTLQRSSQIEPRAWQPRPRQDDLPGAPQGSHQARATQQLEQLRLLREQEEKQNMEKGALQKKTTLQNKRVKNGPEMDSGHA